jgi:hypothetical protein
MMVELRVCLRIKARLHVSSLVDYGRQRSWEEAHSGLCCSDGGWMIRKRIFRGACNVDYGGRREDVKMCGGKVKRMDRQCDGAALHSVVR